MRRDLKDHVVLLMAAFVMGAPLALVLLGAGAPELGEGSSLDGLARNVERLARLAGETRAGPSLSDMVLTSLAIGGGVALLTTSVSFLAAFAMTFVVRKRARLLFGLTLLTLYFPIEARMLPTFDIAAKLGLIDTLAGLVLPILPLAMATFIFRQHLRTLPPEYLEAARLDGAGPIAFLRDFAIPLSRVPIGAVLVITFLVGWNQYLWPLMISVDNSLFPLMRGLNLAGTGSGASMLIATLSMLPPLILVIACLRLMTRVTAVRM